MHGFKEWDVICRALECGWQSLSLRAGGIHDVAKWHEDLPERFFLMPNSFHESLESVRRVPPEFDQEQQRPRWQIRSWAEVMHVVRIDDPQVLKHLEPFHILQSEVVERRFQQNDPPALWLLLLRVYLLPQPWNLPDDPEFGGCRSVIPLPRPPFPLVGKPVLEDGAFLKVQEQLDNVLLSR